MQGMAANTGRLGKGGFFRLNIMSTPPALTRNLPIEGRFSETAKVSK
jgi:hypothetical protein